MSLVSIYIISLAAACIGLVIIYQIEGKLLKRISKQSIIKQDYKP